MLVLQVCAGTAVPGRSPVENRPEPCPASRGTVRVRAGSTTGYRVVGEIGSSVGSQPIWRRSTRYSSRCSLEIAQRGSEHHPECSGTNQRSLSPPGARVPTPLADTRSTIHQAPHTGQVWTSSGKFITGTVERREGRRECRTVSGW